MQKGESKPKEYLNGTGFIVKYENNSKKQNYINYLLLEK